MELYSLIVLMCSWECNHSLTHSRHHKCCSCRWYVPV